MKKIKLLIAGSRNFTSYDFLKMKTEQIIGKELHNQYIIISGGARGVDTLAKHFAYEHTSQFKEFAADWNKYGKRAGYIRNIEMGKQADMAIIFWDGKSKGTKHMIDIIQKYEKTIYIIMI